jgi:benzoate transport
VDDRVVGPVSGAPAAADPREWLAAGPMGRTQVAVVAITIALCALDGFDVLSIGFAAPGIAREWGIDRAALGVVLSMELIGMVVGSLFVGALSDRAGRRGTMLGCLVVMAFGMAMASGVGSIEALSAWRVITGLGVGGMIPTLNAVATEFASARRRDLSVALMSCGYPVGVIVGGTIAALLLRGGHWRHVFALGAGLTATLIPIVARVVPESVAWLCQQQPARALERVNRSLARLGYAAVAALPPARKSSRVPLAEIFGPGLRAATVLTTLAYFLHITTYYFVLKWVPKLVVDMGYSQAAAAGVLVWANVGSVCGGTLVGLLAQRASVKSLTMACMVAAAAMVAAFGQGWGSLAQLSLVCALTGFCAHGAVVGLFAVLARCYPTATRATGTGFAIGIGRGGAVVTLIVSGFLMRAGLGLPLIALLMGMGSLLAALALALLRSASLRPAG